MLVGARAPSFRGRDQHGNEVVLEDLLERGPVVLYFYSKDFSPICTREACAFRDAYEELREAGASIVGISTDEEETHRRFAATHEIPFPLIADCDRSIQRAYGAFRVFGLFDRRVTFVIDRSGAVVAALNHLVSSSRHADEVLAALRLLQKSRR